MNSSWTWLARANSSGFNSQRFNTRIIETLQKINVHAGNIVTEMRRASLQQSSIVPNTKDRAHKERLAVVYSLTGNKIITIPKQNHSN